MHGPLNVKMTSCVSMYEPGVLQPHMMTQVKWNYNSLSTLHNRSPVICSNLGWRHIKLSVTTQTCGTPTENLEHIKLQSSTKKTSEPSPTRNSNEISQQIINNVKSNACKITLSYSEHKKCNKDEEVMQ